MRRTAVDNMKKDLRPFESIESSLEFMILLESVVQEASAELRELLPSAEDKRYRDGITLALFKTQLLAEHVQKSRRILNDLSLIRGLLTGHSAPDPAMAATILELRQSLNQPHRPKQLLTH